jgi:hypothetical protein
MRNKADIEYHALGYTSTRVPAVNVKVHDSLADGFRKWKKDFPNEDERFTLEWIEENISDEALDQLFWYACERGWEDLKEKAREIYGKKYYYNEYVNVFSEGRSGGWAYIHGINHDVDSWDAIEFTKWKRFHNYAKERSKQIMYDVVDGIFFNEFEIWCQEQIEIRDEESELAAPNFPEGLKAAS